MMPQPDTLPADPSHFQAILFDLDGTLVDTDDQVVARATRYLAPLFGRRAPAAARWLLMQAETPGNMLVTTLDLLGLDGHLARLTDSLRRRRGVYPPHEFQLIQGVDELLQSLAAHYRLGIVTSRGRNHIDQFLARFPQLADLFEVSCGLQDTRRLKPHPAPIRLAARRLGVPVASCLMVGDTTVDVRAARRAGAWSAAVLCGFGQQAELERAGAHVVLPGTADLAGLLLGE